MKTFIIADDELLVRVGLRSLTDWEVAGYRLLGEAADGLEALALVERFDPDIVVTDLVMPRMDGLELIRRLRADGSRAGIVVLSCKNDFESAREALRLGADDYVFKLTLSGVELLESFVRALAKRPARAEDEAPQGTAAVAGFGSFVAAALAGTGAGAGAVAVVVAPPSLHRPHRILAIELPGASSGAGAAADLLRELGRRDSAVLEAASAGDRSFLAVANGGRAGLRETFDRAAEYAARYLGSAAAGAYSPLSLDAGFAAEGVRLAAQALSLRTFGPCEILAFADDPIPSGAFEPERYASACLELSRAVDAWDADRCNTAIDSVADSLRLPENSARLRSLFSDALVPFRLRARALGFDPETVPDAPAPDRAVRLARTVAEAAELASRYAAAFIPFALARSGLRKEIAAVRRWVLADLRRSFTVEDAALVAGMSASHFAHVFKEETGTSFIDFVNRSRLDRARELLLTGGLLVKEIADLTGFDNSNYFCSLFKRTFGATPNEVREGKGGQCP